MKRPFLSYFYSYVRMKSYKYLVVGVLLSIPIAYYIILLHSKSSFMGWHPVAVETFPGTGSSASRPKPASDGSRQQQQHAKWIVITTVAHPTDDVKKLAAMDGWKVVVVGDLKTPQNWSHTNCVYLSVDEQEKLGYLITKSLPYSSYTRKNVGYLYAIQHGARYIYDTDDDNHPKSGALEFQLGANTSGLIYEGAFGDTVNPCAHFGQPSIWPRGYPLDAVNVPNGRRYTLCHFRTPAVQQGMVDGDPDVDAIYRLTQKETGRRTVNVTFDSRAPPVALPRGVFAPFNSQNTLFTYDALWSLFLPATVAFRVTDIWRGYWAQRLLWLLGHRLAFFPPNAVQVRNAHDYLKDFVDEEQMYRDTQRLVDFLKGWTCANRAFFGCVSDLGHQMAKAEFWGETDARAIDDWIEDLKSLGYREPEMLSDEAEWTACFPDAQPRTVYFGAAPQERRPTTFDPATEYLRAFCDPALNSTPMAKVRGPPRAYPNVLLIVVYNSPHYDSIRFLDNLYSEHFPNMAYCGQTASHEALEAAMDKGPRPWRQRPITFLNITASEGYFAYECALLGIRMRYQVDGLLVVADDLLFNHWNLEPFDKDALRIQQRSYRRANLTQRMKWPWWERPCGRNATAAALEELAAMRDSHAHGPEAESIRAFFRNRERRGFREWDVALCASDLYYVPRRHFDTFAYVLDAMLRHRTFLEIAVPTAITGLDPVDGTGGFVGSAYWLEERNDVLKRYRKDEHYLHPLKLSKVLRSAEMTGDYCRVYIGESLANWYAAPRGVTSPLGAMAKWLHL